MDTFQVLKNDPYRRCMLILNNGDNTCVDRSLSLIQLDPQGSHPGQQWPWEGRCPKGENVFCPLWYLSEPLWSFVTRMKSLQVSYMFNLFGGNNVRMTIRSSAPLYTCQRQNFPKNISISSRKGASHLWKRVHILLVWFSTIKKLQPFSWAFVTFSQNVLVLKIPILYPYPWWRCKKKRIAVESLAWSEFHQSPFHSETAQRSLHSVCRH